VGIDLTESDIASASETVEFLGLSNAQFHVYDLTELPGPFGQFDYIVCHGLYAWLPPEIREKLLEVIAASLAPHGIVYVSHNAMPGGRVRMMIREMMLFHLRDVADPEARIADARDFLEFMKLSHKDRPNMEIVTRQVGRMLTQPDHSLFHDELAEHFHPPYHHEFVAHAKRYGLQYLSEGSYADSRPEILGFEAAPIYAKFCSMFAPDASAAVQYLDFARCTYFHQTLLVRAENALDRNLRPDRLRNFSFGSPSSVVPSESTGEPGNPEEESYLGVNDCKITTADPIVKQLMHAMLDAYPRSLAFADLPHAATNPEPVANYMLALMNLGQVAAHVYSPAFSLTPGERPAVSALVRRQAILGHPLSNLRHCSVEAEEPIQKSLLPLLDGTRDRAALQAELSIPADDLNSALTALAGLCLFLPEEGGV
jgi:hypothetical protein